MAATIALAQHRAASPRAVVDLGREQPIEVGERRPDHHERRAVSFRWLTGAVLTGLFANSGINAIFGSGKATGFFEGNHMQLVHQLVGVGIAWGLSIVGTLLILFVVDKLIGLRVSEDAEREGLDLSQHGEEGYDWETA